MRRKHFGMTTLLTVAFLLGIGIESARADFALGGSVDLGPHINTGAEEWGPCYSADGLELYFSSRRAGGSGGSDLYVSKRASAGEPWGIPVNLGSSVNSSADDHSQSISSGGLELYFTSKRTGALVATTYGYRGAPAQRTHGEPLSIWGPRSTRLRATGPHPSRPTVLSCSSAQGVQVQ